MVGDGGEIGIGRRDSLASRAFSDSMVVVYQVECELFKAMITLSTDSVL